MHHPTHRLLHTVALLSIAALCLGNSCKSSNNGFNPGGSGGTGGTGGTGGAGGGNMNDPLAGIYIERYSCQLDDGTCLEVDVRIVMEVKSLGGDQYQIDDRGSNATTTSARLVGNGLEWRSVDPDFPGFVERGLWTLDFSSAPTTFVKESVFGQAEGSTGECVGTGIKEGGAEPDPPPAFSPPCTPQ